jgi:hypothetical protein
MPGQSKLCPYESKVRPKTGMRPFAICAFRFWAGRARMGSAYQNQG